MVASLIGRAVAKSRAPPLPMARVQASNSIERLSLVDPLVREILEVFIQGAIEVVRA
eukprot:SAG31_NODE_1368_length_8614_cov_12.018203_5_plen_57_part_00